MNLSVLGCVPEGSEQGKVPDNQPHLSSQLGKTVIQHIVLSGFLASEQQYWVCLGAQLTHYATYVVLPFDSIISITCILVSLMQLVIR